MMDNEGKNVTPDEIRSALKRATVLNEYLLRRSWGILFLVLALSMFLTIFGVSILEVAKSFGVVSSMAISLAASGTSMIVILWAFKRVRNWAEITHPEGSRAWSRLLGYRFLVPLWIAVNAIAIVTIVFARSQVSLVLLLIYFGLSVYLYYAIRLSFSEKIPGEAAIAIGSLSLSSIASIALLSITTSHGPYVLLWGATIIAWVFSGTYAHTRSVPEFEEERTGLE